MAVNFGTYEGHRILSNAMANTVDTVTRGFENKIKNEQWERNFKEQQANDAILREKADYQMKALKKDFESEMAREEYLRNAYTNPNAPVLRRNEAGDLVPVDNYLDAFDTLDRRSDIGSILAANPAMGYDIAVQTSGNLDEAYKKSILGTRKQFVGMDDEEINEWFARHPEFATAYNKELIDAGIPRGDTDWAESIRFTDPNAIDSDIDGLGLKSKGWGSTEDDGVEIYGDKGGWGGGIYFKGYSNPGRIEKKHGDLILEALKTSKEGEAEGWLYGGDWSGDRSDDIWVKQTGDGFQVTEDDAGHNDTYDIKMYGDIPWVMNADGSKWKELSSMKSSDWE